MALAVLTTSRFDRRLILVVALCAVVVFAMPLSVAAAGTDPTVTGPIAAAGIPGNPMHNYPFFATNHELATRGTWRRNSSSRASQIDTTLPRKRLER